MIADKLDCGAEIVLKNRRLIPMPDLSDVDLRRSEFNKMRKQMKLSPFGSEYVVVFSVLFIIILRFLVNSSESC